jgi:hypothetical protein
MNGKTGIALLVVGLLSACAPPQPAPPPAPPAPAPAAAPTAVAAVPSGDRLVSIRGARCDRLLALSEDDRAAASMFYIGYEARRFGTRAINVATIPSITGLALDYCALNPNRPVADVYAEAYLETRRW